MENKINLSTKRLTELESVIKAYRQNFHSVGSALKEILDGHHYHKLSFRSFESYVRVRWDIGRSQAYRLIDASVVIDNLSPIGDVLPKNEAQARPLTKLDRFSQKKVWSNFLKTGKSLSALNIKKFVSAHLGEQKSGSSYVEVVSQDYMEAVSAMLSQIIVSQNEQWASTTQKTALHWNQIMKEKILWEIA